MPALLSYLKFSLETVGWGARVSPGADAFFITVNAWAPGIIWIK